MKMRLLYAVLVLFVMILNSCTSEALEEIPSIEVVNIIALEKELLSIVNMHRSSLQQNELEFSAVAYNYANQHTDYMIAKGSISHDNFSARASHMYTELDVKMVSENVAKDYKTATETFNGWYNSSSHKKTMEGNFTHTAVSVKQDSTGTLYFTQLFYKE